MRETRPEHSFSHMRPPAPPQRLQAGSGAGPTGGCSRSFSLCGGRCDPASVVVQRMSPTLMVGSAPRLLTHLAGAHLGCGGRMVEEVDANAWLQKIRADPGHSAWYVERFRTMAAAGDDLAGEARLIDAMVPRGSRILDAGCGPGRVGAVLARLGHDVVGVDPVSYTHLRAH